MQVKGRYLVIGWTAVFLAVALTISFRARRGFETQIRLREVRDSVQATRAMRDAVRNSINGMIGRYTLGPRVAATGLRMASDSEVIKLHLPPDR
jgi:hypothetical protein